MKSIREVCANIANWFRDYVCEPYIMLLEFIDFSIETDNVAVFVLVSTALTVSAFVGVSVIAWIALDIVAYVISNFWASLLVLVFISPFACIAWYVKTHILDDDEDDDYE